jgi:NitT/TauT family transport system ATP-binding protein
LCLELKGICKTFGNEKPGTTISVLEDINYRIEEGKFFSIIGPSGCGKTTLLRIIAGLEKASRGEVLLGGEKIDHGEDLVGLVFQQYALFPWRTALENIEMGLEIMGIHKRERLAAALEYVKSFGLSGFENRYPGQLSGGMQQRVAIARTLVMKPRLVLMDEPFGSLDSQTRNEMQEFLLEVWQKRGETIVFVTHNVDEAVFLSDEIAVLSGRPARMVNRYKIDYPKPRDRTSPECNAIRRGILRDLEVLKAAGRGSRAKVL